jgi:hypothetical protein
VAARTRKLTAAQVGVAVESFAITLGNGGLNSVAAGMSDK